MENRTDYERKRSELDHRHANPEWMKDNIGWIFGAMAIALIVGGIYHFSANHPRATSVPDDTTTGRSTATPMSSTPPVRLSLGYSLDRLQSAAKLLPKDPDRIGSVIRN